MQIMEEKETHGKGEWSDGGCNQPPSLRICPEASDDHGGRRQGSHRLSAAAVSCGLWVLDTWCEEREGDLAWATVMRRRKGHVGQWSSCPVTRLPALPSPGEI